MSPWDRHSRARAGQQRQQQQLTWILTGGASLFVLMTVLLYLFWPAPEPVDLTNIAESEPTEKAPVPLDSEDSQTENSQFSALSFVPSSLFSTSEEAVERKLNTLNENLANHQTARFQYAQTAPQRGPQQLKFTVSASGQDHKHAVGVATYADTAIVGAANEWQIRPWWRLGWLPTTSDCGEPGTAAIGGHVSWLERPGPLNDLGAMQVGEIIECQAKSGAWYTYEVYEVVQVGYENTRYYWQPPSNKFASELSLFSCKPELTGIIVVRAKLMTDN